MATRWTMRISHWGWSLYDSGQLVASADNPRDLIGLVAGMTSNGEN